MSRKLVIFVAIMAFSFLGSAFAAVENIKVGGDITIYGVNRGEMDLGENGLDDAVSGLASVTNLRLDADLTEDVSATAVITDERVWGVSSGSDIYLNQGYITLGNVLGYPVTLKMGLMPVVLGSGLIVADPDTNRTAASGSPFRTQYLGDLSPRKSFEGIVGIADLSPATLTLAYLKVSEGSGIAINDDTNAYAGYLTYDFGNNVVGDVYLIQKDTVKKVGASSRDDTTVAGVRVIASPLDNLTLSGEFAYQWRNNPSVRSVSGDATDRAGIVSATYAFLDQPWSPTVGVDYTFISTNWDPMFEGLTPANIANALFPLTDVSCIGLTLTAQPREDINVKLRYVNLRLVDKISALSNDFASYAMDSGKKSLGNEVDLGITYDYTEDVQVGLCLDYFKPGSAFAEANDDSAFQAVSSVKVSY